MNKYLLPLSALFFVSTCAVAQKPKKQVVFFEDFNQKALDRTKWNVEITGQTVNDEQQAYIDSAATIYLTNGKTEGAKNGALVLQALYKPGHTSKEGKRYDFVSGRINTRDKMMFTYGTASVRMKMEDGAGLWPAFWALGKGNWPDCGEIDVMETVGDGSWVSNACMGQAILATPRLPGAIPLQPVPMLPNGTFTAWIGRQPQSPLRLTARLPTPLPKQ